VQPERVEPAPFIVGAGRSGTTLLRLMLDAHPELAIPAETHFVPRVAGCATPEAAIECIRSASVWRDLNLDGEALAERAAGAADPRAVLREMYALYAEGQGKPRWGDKTPAYVRSMPAVAEALPEARFVHIIRDGRDVAASVRGLWFGGDTIADTARWWSGSIAQARRDAAGVTYLEVRYEDLVREPEPVLRRICDFVDLAWDPATLTYPKRAAGRLAELGNDVVRADGTVTTGAQRMELHQLALGPPVPTRIGRWRSELAPAEVRAFEEVAGPLLRELSYEAG
jgi:hypothetical protein